MDNQISQSYLAIKREYDLGGAPTEKLGKLFQDSIDELEAKSKSRFQGKIGEIDYSVFYLNDVISRPIRDTLLSTKKFEQRWNSLMQRLKSGVYLNEKEQNELDSIVYTGIMSISCVYDLWQTKSRKTPGTIFEITTGSLLSLFYANLTRTKHVRVPDSKAPIPTDIVLTAENGKSVVIPVKITTRERIVQPFAHQRILSSTFGDKYKSVIVCASEIQRAKDDGVNQICVPGTIILFSKHLAKVSGIIYLDPPKRYLEKDITSVVPIKAYSSLFTDYFGNFFL